MTPRYHRHADLRLTALAGEGVVLHMKERRYFTVNETGLTILEALREPKSFEELVAAILAEYEVTREEAERTTREFLTRCSEAGLLEERA
ncbi:MAG TPA: PqqD family protein [Gemmatimonadales bacterium]|jgi:hypothetical protein|nr:PqqD family protein [Gemmatimonadales bacterium]